MNANRSKSIKQDSSHNPPTLMHVARLAGVGLGTASRAISGRGYVRKETLARINEAVERLGYRRNEVARSLRERQSYVVAIVVPDIGGPFMVDCVRAAQSVLRQHSYFSVLAFTDGDSATEKQELEYLIARQIDGLLVIPADASAAHLGPALGASVATVAFDQPLAAKGFDAVLVKNRQATREAVQHLLGHGHERIACVGVNRHLYSIRRRIEGYRDAMSKAGLAESIVVSAPEEIDAQIERMLHGKEAPTAILALNELSSLKVIEALSARRIRMPDQVAFVGFDELQLGRYFDPPLSVVVQPAALIGEQAALRLLERIEAGEELPGKHYLLDPKLILRRSCGCCACVPSDGNDSIPNSV